MKVVHLHLYEPYEGHTDFYFGSVKAIYDHVPKLRVGIVYSNLCTVLRRDGVYRNKQCAVGVGVLLQRKRSAAPILPTGK